MDFDIMNITGKFIGAYREVEKGSPEVGKGIINYIEKNEYTAQHLCNSWAGRKQDWGDFYLNLSHNTQYRILQFWGIKDPAGDAYLKKMEANPLAMTWANPPDIIMWPHELLKFFYNHGINETPAEGITLPSLPAEEFRYGNSTNWGEYVMNLSYPDAKKLLTAIYDRAKIRYQDKK